MKSPETAVLAQAQGRQLAPVCLASFAGWGGTTVRWAGEGEDIEYPGGTLYDGRRFQLSGFTLGTDGNGAAATLTADDADLYVTKLCLAASPRGLAVTISRLYLDPATWLPVGSETLAAGLKVVSISYPQAQVEFSLRGTLEATRRQAPGRLYQRGCPWVFKDPLTCAYAGLQTVCDRTYTTCKALGNELNYGGIDLLAPRQY